MVDRDDVVSEALRSLEVPEHRPGFWAELSERLDEEWTTAPASRVPALDRSMDPTGAGKRRGLGARWLAVAAAVAIVAAGALVATRAGDGDGGRAPVPPAGTPDPTTTTVGRVSSVQGTLVIEVAGEAPERAAFALDDRGRFAVRGEDGSSLVSDGAAGIAVTTTDNGETFARSGVPPVPLGATTDADGVAFLRRDLGWAIAALAADGDDRVTTGEHDGRPVWRFDADLAPNPLADGSVDRLLAVVDRATALPLLVRESAGGEVVAERRVEDLRIGAPIDEAMFEVPDHLAADDAGWRRAATDGAPAVDVPDGYALATVAVHDDPLVTGPEGGNPATGPVTAYVYRRGIDVLVVTVQPAGGPGAVWDDPLGVEGVPATTPFTGATRGGIALDPRAVPHTWARDGQRVVLVAGAATGHELTAALRSLLG